MFSTDQHTTIALRSGEYRVELVSQQGTEQNETVTVDAGQTVALDF